MKKGSKAAVRPARPAVRQDLSAPPPPAPRTAQGPGARLAQAGPYVLFAAASIFGFLEVHSSTDTWISLAAGRQIVAQTSPFDLRGTFPIRDAFSYTFFGAVWYNQNWLTHVVYWLLYAKLGRSAVVIGTWAACVAIFSLVLLATKLRCGSWLAATLAAAVVAAATRDWVSARPATVQFLCLAILWVCLAALLAPPRDERGRRRRRWWPIFALLPLMLFWGGAHGSFVLGYAMIGLFLACWLAGRLFDRLFRRHEAPRLDAGRAAAMLASGAVAALLTAAIGPYGVENFTHPWKVKESERFRDVGEWRKPDALEDGHVPPTLAGRIERIARGVLIGLDRPDRSFPPVDRFWWALRCALAAPIVAMLVVGIDRLRRPPDALAARSSARVAGVSTQAILLDLASVALGLYMVFFARRFAPIFYILAAPAVTAWIVRIGRLASESARRASCGVLVAASWIGAAWVGWLAWDRAHQELVLDFEGLEGYDLLDRVTRFDHYPRAALAFLRDNDLPVNLLTDWTHAGVVMFHCPRARVFMDGRAQQVYTEEHYNLFSALMEHPPEAAPRVLQVLDGYRPNDRAEPTDAVLVRFSSVLIEPDGRLTGRPVEYSIAYCRRRPGATWRHTKPSALRATLWQSPQWVRVLYVADAELFLRRGSAAHERFRAAERSGVIRWPDSPEADLSRGEFWADDAPPDPLRAAGYWMSAVQRRPALGVRLHARIVDALLVQGHADQADSYISRESSRVSTDVAEPELREALLGELRRCRERLAAPAPRPPLEPHAEGRV